jgi:dihydrolipoamide dehydrogenase
MYDIIILGGGPGGYMAAERAGDRGKSVLLIEKEELGGVCLNHGCIPTKSLLHSAKLFLHASEGAKLGIRFQNGEYDLPAAMKWKQKTVKKLVKGVEYLMDKYDVDMVKGEGRLVDRNTLAVRDDIYQGEHIIIATGSRPAIPPIPGIHSENVMTSRDILQIKELPEKIVIIGGGVIGMEFASFFSCLDIEVHVVEMLDEILPVMESDIARTMRRAMESIEFHLGARVEKIVDNSVTLSINGETSTISGDIVLVATGRKPNVDNLGFREAGMNIGPNGIRVNEQMQTNLPGVYAVGDVTGKSMLAHSAYRMGEVAVNVICGDSDRMRYSAVPWVVYSLPEAAGCGLGEADAIEKGIDVKTAKIPMRMNGRFLAEYGDAAGFCKVVVHENSQRLLGIHMLGGGCSELISGAASMIESELRVKDIREIIFPHPTVSEIIKDTVWQVK